MIYEYPAPDEPIRQGDIFAQLPRVDLDLAKLAVLAGDEVVESTWQSEASAAAAGLKIIVAARPVNAVVITQDCDASRAEQITLCEIRSAIEVLGQQAPPKTPGKWVSLLTKQSRQNLKWFYLPPDERAGFDDRMAVDFQTTISVLRRDLEQLRFRRRARLGTEADEHFRERLSEYFRRYPYDEWYPLNKAEFEEYRSANPDADPRPWQK